ncbi:hypothetical protein [Pleionea litopenaei]|uniref:Uncharacterized protein n=1 Tax=Pleionea litopenaei TaxID=3070815 RepID=A0AA51X724_9GAMM|nr:hypothetical protein [Pleionea sp. HL-JVS1]WMS86650.1 hypothetical protein Q9312_15620 [Pleionea sp. HL-JVS1]
MVRIIVAMIGGAIAVVLITLVAVGIYGMFPSDDDSMTVTPIILDDVMSETDYKIEGLNCKCQSEKLEFERQETSDGLGCKASVLSMRQRQELPKCQLPNAY